MSVTEAILEQPPAAGRALLARSDLLLFTRRMFPTYEVADHHKRVALALHAIERGDLDRLVITMPPRHGKSELASVHFPAWFLGRNPDQRVIAASYASSLAYRFSRRARNLMAHPLWPFDVRTAGDLANVQQWDIEGHRGGYYAAGVGGGIAGHGANLLLIDDPVRSAEQADSETARESAWEWFRHDAVTRLEPGGRIVLIGTRWHEDDLIGRALASGEPWEHLDLPALSDAGVALWPARWGVDKLARIRTQVGERAWAALYQQRPAPQEGEIFKRQWWRYWHRLDAPLPPVLARTPDGAVIERPCVPLPAQLSEIVQSWDMTFKDTKGADFVCGQVWGLSGANRYLLDQVLARLDFPSTVAAIRDLSARWPQARRIFVEDSANGPAVIAHLHNELSGLIAVKPQGGKVARAHAVTAEIESGNVYLPHPRIASWVDGLVEEAAVFPAGRHDDQVDAMTQALAKIAGKKGAAAAVVAPSGGTVFPGARAAHFSIQAGSRREDR